MTGDISTGKFSSTLRSGWKHRRVCAALFLLALQLSPGLATAAPEKPQAISHNSSDVDPFIGVDWGGNTFVGVAIPFGMVKLGPDMETFDGRRSGFGYWSDGQILGFSQLHLSGAQGKYGNIQVMPVTGPIHLDDVASTRTDEVNTVGYYAARLSRYHLLAELTSTRRVGMERYTFASTGAAHVLVNLAACLGHGTGPEDQRFLGADVHVTSNSTAEGVARFKGGWNEGGEYRVYFAIELQTPASSVETWTGPVVPLQPITGKHAFAMPTSPPAPATLTSAHAATVDSDTTIGVAFNYATHPGQVLQLKVGISLISAEQAKQNIAAELPGWNFNAVHHASVRLWDQALSRVTLTGATPVERRKVYTAMYHTMLMPTDRTGENPDWHSDEPYYDDYYAIWDTFRSSGPWLTLVAPERERDLIRSLIDIYRHTGWMPDARSGNDNGRTQGGSNADVMVTDAWVRGLKGIDYPTAYQAMLKNAEVEPEHPQKEGRGGIEEFNKKGYISLKYERSGSRTVEYSYDDFALAELACGLGHPQQAALYAKRANNWQNLWDPTLEVGGFKGFLRPRKPDGSWAAPYLVIRGTWPDFFYEGDLWTYSFYAPQDVRRLIAMSGGDRTFLARMDTLFYRGHFDVTNEPGFLIPVLYNWAGRPDKTADAVTQLLEKYFTANRAGIPGNDDSGAMSSWMLFQTIGFYPDAGQDFYLIGSPSLPDTTIRLGNGKLLHILVRNLIPSGLNHYVASVTWNGKPWTRNWFRQSDIANGGTWIFTMSSAPTSWGTTDPPPSMSDTGANFCPRLGASAAEKP
jgi:predicted alpha-1,2-mannosidase